MSDLAHHLFHAVALAFGMFWKTAWSLVLGFGVSAVLQAVVSAESMRRVLGRAGIREVSIASLAGAASSSCSYASASISRTLFKKGAALIPSLAFLLASTNLVVELGIVLYLLMGWPFTAGEWVGGVVMIACVSALVRLTYPAALVEQARHHPEAGAGGHDHGGDASETGTWLDRLKRPETRVAIAQTFVMDWRMLWKDLALGFVIAGILAAFVPDSVWQALFVQSAPPAVRTVLDAAIGPLVGIVTFVCSIGNVPMAAVLWASGVSFGGVLAFLYSDLIVLPLLDVYRRYYGWRMALYIAAVLYGGMVAAAVVMDLAFTGLHLIPARNGAAMEQMAHIGLDYTFWLNLAFGVLAVWLFAIARRSPARAHACAHHGHAPAAASPMACHASPKVGTGAAPAATPTASSAVLPGHPEHVAAAVEVGGAGRHEQEVG